MTDRELLELAARAAGHTGFSGDDYQGPYFCIPADPAIPRSEPQILRWLTDDGDALRLAVMLRLSVNCDGDEPWVEWSDEDAEDGERHVSEGPNGDDHFAATRRAIVRAAAEIGKTLGE